MNAFDLNQSTTTRNFRDDSSPKEQWAKKNAESKKRQQATRERLKSKNDTPDTPIRDGGGDWVPRTRPDGSSDGDVGGGVPDGYEETDVILCVDGSPVSGTILFKEDEA